MMKSELKSYQIGETNLCVEETSKPGKQFTYFILHENEETAIRSANEVLKRNGGRLIVFRHKNSRNINFLLKNEEYIFDPNRIFSDGGIKNTLLANGNYSNDALNEIKRFVKEFKRDFSIDKLKFIVTVHNNIDSYSLNDYIPNGKHALDSKEIFVL